MGDNAMQAIVDAMSSSMASARQDYHLTLGRLIETLAATRPDKEVFIDQGGYPGALGSYRGYYEDLAFSKQPDPISAAELLDRCMEAMGTVFEGYKGGDYTAHDKAALWLSDYGTASGVAIMGADDCPDAVILKTKSVYDD